MPTPKEEAYGLLEAAEEESAAAQAVLDKVRGSCPAGSLTEIRDAHLDHVWRSHHYEAQASQVVVDALYEGDPDESGFTTLDGDPRFDGYTYRNWEELVYTLVGSALVNTGRRNVLIEMDDSEWRARYCS